MESLAAIGTWPVGRAAAAALDAGGVRALHGDPTASFPWASVTKLATSLCVAVAVEEGTVDLDAVVTDAGATVRHLLAHASGLSPEPPARQLAAVGSRRIYSNAGYELLGEVLAARSGIRFATYLAEAVLGPLGMSSTRLEGSPAAGLVGPLEDLVSLAAELLSPSLVSAGTAEAMRTTAFPGLSGVVPGFGRHEHCDWGLGPEVKDSKAPHWTAAGSSPRTFGHFGRSGCFVWVDPDEPLALAVLTDTTFGEWAVAAWPALSDAVVAEWRSGRPDVLSRP